MGIFPETANCSKRHPQIIKQTLRTFSRKHSKYLTELTSYDSNDNLDPKSNTRNLSFIVFFMISEIHIKCITDRRFVLRMSQGCYTYQLLISSTAAGKL